MQGPTRLATLVTWLDVDARAAAAHLERLRPHPRGLWVRPCLYCEVPMVVNDDLIVVTRSRPRAILKDSILRDVIETINPFRWGP